MKRKVLILGMILIGGLAVAQNLKSGIAAEDELKRAEKVDTKDTVVFDLSQAVIVGNSMDIPVSVLSDDTINSLDFSMKFNQAKLTYDTLINNASYLQSLAFFNKTDSTLRATSNSLQQYGNNTPLMAIRFRFISVCNISKADFNSVAVYLGGKPCSFKV